MRIPTESLKPETLSALIEEFVTREGTEYGDVDFTLDDKVAAVQAALNDGRAVVWYDDESETCTITLAETRLKR